MIADIPQRHRSEGRLTATRNRVVGMIREAIASRRDKSAGRPHENYGVTGVEATLQATALERIRMGYQPPG